MKQKIPCLCGSLMRPQVCIISRMLSVEGEGTTGNGRDEGMRCARKAIRDGVPRAHMSCDILKEGGPVRHPHAPWDKIGRGVEEKEGFTVA